MGKERFNKFGDPATRFEFNKWNNGGFGFSDYMESKPDVRNEAPAELEESAVQAIGATALQAAEKNKADVGNDVDNQ